MQTLLSRCIYFLSAKNVQRSLYRWECAFVRMSRFNLWHHRQSCFCYCFCWSCAVFISFFHSHSHSLSLFSFWTIQLFETFSLSSFTIRTFSLLSHQCRTTVGIFQKIKSYMCGFYLLLVSLFLSFTVGSFQNLTKISLRMFRAQNTLTISSC